MASEHHNDNGRSEDDILIGNFMDIATFAANVFRNVLLIERGMDESVLSKANKVLKVHVYLAPIMNEDDRFPVQIVSFKPIFQLSHSKHY